MPSLDGRTPTIEELREQERVLAQKHRDLEHQAELVREHLDTSGEIHIRAMTGDKQADQKRRRLRSDLSRLDRELVELEAQRRNARYAVSRAELQEQEAEQDRQRQEREQRQEQVRRATAHKEQLERELAQHLADLGWYMQPAGPIRQELEARALATIRTEHGEGSAEFARDYLLPRLGQDSGVYAGPPGPGAPMSGPAWRFPGDVAV